MVMDCSLIPDIINFLKHQNLIDNKNIIYRNKKRPHIGATHNGFFWDIYAYTKTTGINTVLMSNVKSEDKSTLVVIDVILSKSYSMISLQGFIDRVQIIINSTKQGIRKVLPIIVYTEIAAEAIAKAQNLGYITLDISSIFGERVLKILSELKAIKENEMLASSESSEFIDKIDLVMQSVVDTGQEINLSNMIGDLFESLILHLLKDIYHSSSITPNKRLPNELNISKGKDFEYDFIIDAAFEETIVIETKGYKSKDMIILGDKDRKNTVRWFFNNTFLSAKRHLEKSRDNPIKACYITTAKFTTEALSVLESLNNGKLKPSKIDLFYDGEKLLKLLDEQKNTNLKRVLKKYYFK